MNVTIKLGVATIGLHLEFVLSVLKTPSCIGIGFSKLTWYQLSLFVKGSLIEEHLQVHCIKNIVQINWSISC